MLNELLKTVSVLGAAGKMGKGISLLLLQEMARLEAESTGKVGSGAFSLHLIDTNDHELASLQRYLRTQLRRYAEQNINRLRSYFATDPLLVSNEEIIHAFVEGGLNIIRLQTEIESAKTSSLIFEAIVEDVSLKASVFSTINALNPKAYYFTNTSSIPIAVLSEQSGLDHRLIGYHFYNPPAVQKLLEIIAPANVDPDLLKIAKELAKRLDKIVVHARDVAGFIGNGHFIREIEFACLQVQELEKQLPQTQAITAIDQITKNFLVRPMGIFQLIDYVGIDVCQRVIDVMSRYFSQTFQTELIDEMMSHGIKGGQQLDGSQKPGFFQYDKLQPVKVYSPRQRTYVPIPDIPDLGELPEGGLSWKRLQKEKNRSEIFCEYFSRLFKLNTFGAKFAQKWLIKSSDIAKTLVRDGVAQSSEDVNTVLMHGFYHLYGADLLDQSTEKAHR